MEVVDNRHDEQLVAHAKSLLKLLELVDEGWKSAAALPHLVSLVQGELAEVRGLTTFGDSLMGMEVRYSLRDGWNMPALRLLLNVTTGLGWVRILPGGHVLLDRVGRDELIAFPISTRERLAVARAVGTAPAAVTATSEAWAPAGPTS